MEKFTLPPVVPIEDISQYLGTYSSKTAPAKLTIISENGVLVAKAGDQPRHTHSYRGNHVFENVKENIKLTFHPDRSSLIRNA